MAAKKKGFADIFIPNKNDSKQVRTNKIIMLAVAVLIIAAIIVGAVFLVKSLGKSDDPSGNPSSEVSNPSSEDETSSVDETIFDPGEISYDEETGIYDNAEFLELYGQNPQFVGKLSIPGTKLDYPVVQATDNVYYLNRDFTTSHEPYGIPFLDFRAWLGRTKDESGKVTL